MLSSGERGERENAQISGLQTERNTLLLIVKREKRPRRKESRKTKECQVSCRFYNFTGKVENRENKPRNQRRKDSAREKGKEVIAPASKEKIRPPLSRVAYYSRPPSAEVKGGWTKKIALGGRQ